MSEPTYWRINNSYFQQIVIDGGFLWEPMEPGTYISEQTGEVIIIPAPEDDPA